MNRPFSFAALIIALLLHAGMIALAITGLRAPVSNPPEPLSVTVQLLPLQQEEPPAPPSPPAPPPPVATPPEPQPIQKPKPKPKAVVEPRPPRRQAAPEIKAAPEVPSPPPIAPSSAPDRAAGPTAATVPETPPAPAAVAPPAKTSVYISAEYAAANRKPVYPSMSKRYGEQGTVVLRVLVKADGTAGQVEIRSSSGYPLLDESARSAVQSWRFRPATSDGKPVADWFLIPIPFKLQN